MGHVAVAAAHEAAGRAIDAVERAERGDVRCRERVEIDCAARAGRRRARDRFGTQPQAADQVQRTGDETDSAGRGGGEARHFPTSERNGQLSFFRFLCVIA